MYELKWVGDITECLVLYKHNNLLNATEYYLNASQKQVMDSFSIFFPYSWDLKVLSGGFRRIYWQKCLCVSFCMWDHLKQKKKKKKCFDTCETAVMFLQLLEMNKPNTGCSEVFSFYVSLVSTVGEDETRGVQLVAICTKSHTLNLWAKHWTLCVMLVAHSIIYQEPKILHVSHLTFPKKSQF